MIIIDRESILQIGRNSLGKIVSIFDVPTGKKCGCFCPICGGQLLAKNKNKFKNKPIKENQKQAHFAHIDIECNWSNESLIHLLAKEIILTRKRVKLPSYKISSKILQECQKIEFDNVILEKTVSIDDNYIIPDSICEKGESKLFIEFANTHFVGDKKKNLIKKAKISCVEIFLSDINYMRNDEINYDEIIKRIEIDDDNKVWIYHRKQEIFNEDFQRLIKEEEKKTSLLKDEFDDEFDDGFDDGFDDDFDDDSRHAYVNPLVYMSDEEYLIKQKRLYEWKQKKIVQGYKIKSIYGSDWAYSGEFVYCPILPKNNQKLIRSKCEECKFYLNDVKKDDGKWGIFCGYHNNLIQIN